MRGMIRVAATCVATLAMTAPISAALAQDGGGDVMYERYYYDDAAMTIQVGYEQDRCTIRGVGGGPTQGRYGPYVQSNPIALCRGGQLYPLQ